MYRYLRVYKGNKTEVRKEQSSRRDVYKKWATIPTPSEISEEGGIHYND